jgi:hypothetical protein
VSWPGRIDQGDGTRLLVIDERGSKDQREALGALLAGKHGGAYFEIFAAVCPNTSAPVFKAIELKTDRQRRTAAVRIADVAECVAEPIRNPVDGQEHHARIVLPNGFEYLEAEMANAVRLFAQAGGELEFQYPDTYAQLNSFYWTNGWRSIPSGPLTTPAPRGTLTLPRATR